MAAGFATDQIIDLRYSLMYLESQSGQTVTCLVITNLYLTVPACQLPPYQRKQDWHFIIESEHPLLQDTSNSSGR